MKRTQHHAITLLLVTAIALAAGACAKKGGPPPRPPVVVKLATATSQDTPVIVPAFGTLQDQVSVDIIPQVSGLLQDILVREGSVVTNGQPLFKIDARDYQMRVEQAEGMVSADRANLEMARSTLQRNQPLLEKKLISPDNFDALRTRVAALEAQLQMDEAGLDQARLNLSRCTILSPLTGLCSKRLVDAGNLVAAGMTRLTNIRSHDPLRLECAVSEQYLAALRNAMAAGPVPVTVTPRGDTNSYPGVLTFMDNAVNAMAGTILLRGQIPNPDMKLWPNQFADVSITVSRTQGAIMVPESTVLFGKSGPYLYVADNNGTASLRMVKTGIRYQNLLQVTEGLAAGETVITTGQLMLYPGAVVMDAASLSAAGTPTGEKH